ncbi:hypothetical protein QVA66_03875 [Staphylococcus chromogenes]|nr:hypothetical protein [Staphylococcus chromogenes]
MSGNRKEKLVTISFFELQAGLEDEGYRRTLAVDWDNVLGNLKNNSAMEIKYSGRTLDGVVQEFGDQLCLSLSIDRMVHPRERQRGTGIRKTMQNSGADFDPAEESVVVFFDRNIFAMLSTGQGAPSHAALASWLNYYAPVTRTDLSQRWQATPIIRNDVYHTLIKPKNMSISSSTFEIKPSEIDENDYGFLGIRPDIARNLDDECTVGIVIKSGRSAESKRRNASEIERRVDDVLNHMHPRKAKITAKPEDGKQRIFNLIESKLTHQTGISYEAFDTQHDFAETANRELRDAFQEMRDILFEQVPRI